MINDKKVSNKLVPSGSNRLQVNNNNNNNNNNTHNNAKCNDTVVGAVKKSKSMIRKSMITNNKDDSMLLSLNKQQQKQKQQQQQLEQQPQQPIIVSEIKARYRFGSKSNNYSTNWLKGNIPVIKFKPIEENVILDHTITQSSSRKCSSNKKIKFNNNNKSNLIFKSATIDEVSSLKPLRKKHLSSKSSINVSKRQNQAPPKVVSVAGTKQPPPPKTLTSKSVHIPTGKLVHYKSCPIQLAQPTITTTPCLQMPTFPPFCIKLQFKL
jgi:hypothetical protein